MFSNGISNSFSAFGASGFGDSAEDVAAFSAAGFFVFLGFAANQEEYQSTD
jgi:hypothetical protein